MSSRFKLEKMPDGRWIVTHLPSGTSIKFREHDFNNSQEVDYVKGIDPYAMPGIMREIGDWMAQNHYDLCF